MMAVGKTILVSDVYGLCSLVKEGQTGYVFKAENSENLLKKLLAVRCNKGNLNRIGNNARKWVIENRSWETVSSGYKEIYERLLLSNSN